MTTNTNEITATDSYKVAITTTYHGPTNYKGSRIKAQGPGNPAKFYPVDNELSMAANHARAAVDYARTTYRHDKPQHLTGGTCLRGMTWIFTN